MRFLLDENADGRLGNHLRSRGHDVATIAADFQARLSDPSVLATAYREQRILLTNDRHFGELVVVHGHPHAGIIYFRLGRNADLRTKSVDLIMFWHTMPINSTTFS